MIRLLAPWFFPAPITALNVIAAHASATARQDRARRTTSYHVDTSEKFDALCLVNLLADDPFYVTYYPAERVWWRERVSAQTLAAAHTIRRVLKDEGGGIASASLVLYLSASSSTTVSGTLADLDDPECLRERFRRTPYYDPGSWSRFASIVPELGTVQRGLENARFPEHWAATLKPSWKSAPASSGRSSSAATSCRCKRRCSASRSKSVRSPSISCTSAARTASGSPGIVSSARPTWRRKSFCEAPSTR
jgi:hypothetical protein